MSERNYQRDVQIEVNSLDLEWVRHPHKFMYYSETAAKANDIVRRMKNDLELIDAKLDKEFRESMEGKVTEGAVKAKITEDERHLQALMNYNDSLYHAELCAAAVKAMEHKKVALQNLVQLLSASYFAGPKVPRDLKKEIKIEEEGIEKQKELAREAVAVRIRKQNQNTGE
jgi:hypothetical protein